MNAQRTGISITGEVTAPLDEGAALQVPRGDSVASDGADNSRVGKFGLRGDHTVSDVVVDGLVMVKLATQQAFHCT